MADGYVPIPDTAKVDIVNDYTYVLIWYTSAWEGKNLEGYVKR